MYVDQNLINSRLGSTSIVYTASIVQSEATNINEDTTIRIYVAGI